MKNFTKKLTNKGGFIYIMVTFVISMIFVLLMLDTGEVMIRRIDKQTKDTLLTNSRFALDTTINFGEAAALNMSPGESVDLQHVCYPDEFINETELNAGAPPDGAPCDKFVGTYEVESLAVDIDPSLGNERYIVPPPGEGDAGKNCIRPNNYNNPAHSVDENILKPCNWNKLYYGKAVAIPLYITDEGNLAVLSNGGTINPVDLPDAGGGPGLTSFTIKVRTPCAGGHEYDNGNLAGPDEDDWCLGEAPSSATGPDARPELEDGDPTSAPADFSPRDIIVHWQIVSTCNYEPSDAKDGECIGMAISPTSPYIDPAVPYSDINKEAINYAKEFYNYAVVGTLADVPRRKIDDLNVNSTTNPTILDYLKNDLPTTQLPPGATSVTINRPVLYLSAVSPMTTYIDPVYYPENNEYVPYIEYQIETDQPISDSNFTIRATGRFGDHSDSKKKKLPIFNAFPSFVFQN